MLRVRERVIEIKAGGNVAIRESVFDIAAVDLLVFTENRETLHQVDRCSTLPIGHKEVVHGRRVQNLSVLILENLLGDPKNVPIEIGHPTLLLLALGHTLLVSSQIIFGRHEVEDVEVVVSEGLVPMAHATP